MIDAVRWTLTGLLSLTLVTALARGGNDRETTEGEDGCVILLHGLWRTELSMKPLEWALSDAGYGVVNLSYPSLIYPVDELAESAVGEGVVECRSRGLRPVNFVTHSLGGILVREYLAHREIAELGRVVMLGPPNQGSEAAEYIHSLSLLRPFTPEAVEQLGTGDQSLVRQLGPVKFELGVIAGTASHLGFLPGFPTGVSDGTVAVVETLVPGMKDFLVMPVSHTFMIWDEAAIRQVIHFLRHGEFYREDAAVPDLASAPGSERPTE